MDRKSILLAATLMLAAVTSTAVNRWVQNGWTGGAKKESCDLGNVTGDVGCVRGWDHVSSGVDHIVTDADLGGQWAKGAIQSQYPLATCAKIVNDTHYHQFALLKNGCGVSRGGSNRSFSRAFVRS